MALHPHQRDLKKLIFAPSPSPGPGQAGQFLKHEPLGGLRRTDLHPTDPIAQFHSWYSAATSTATIAHAEACTLSTASLPSGRVSARVVYLKELDPLGFVVYTNLGTSRKARDLFGDGSEAGTPNPWAALSFWWEPLERQVRVEGRVERLSREESQEYFDMRVRGSRIGAWASRQSVVLEPQTEAQPGVAGGVGADDGRAQLQQWVREVEERFQGKDDIPCPDFWGGIRVVPERVEFWQGRQNRLHDRFVYDRATGDDGGYTWTLERLSP